MIKPWMLIPPIVGGGGSQVPPVANLSLWLKADAITGLSDGDSVSSWADFSGNENDAAQATAAHQPVYKTGIINGKPVVRFAPSAGNEKIMDVADDDTIDLTSAFTIYAVAYVNGRYNTTDSGFLFVKAGSTDASGAQYGFGGGNDRWVVNCAFGGSSWQDHMSSNDQAWPTQTWVVVSAYYDGTNVIIENHGDATGPTSLGDTDAPVASTGLLQIGGYSHSWSGDEYFQGDIAEILIYKSTHDAATRNQIIEYLQTKYNIAPAE